MTEKIEKRKGFLINLLFLAAVLGITYIFFKYLFWAVAPFLLSFFFAVLIQKPLRFLDKKTGGKLHTFWTLFIILLSIAVILVPVVLIFANLAGKIAGLFSYLKTELADFPRFVSMVQTELLKLLNFLPDSIYSTASKAISDTADKLINNFDLSALGINKDTVTSTITTGVTGIYSIVKNVPSLVISLVVGIIAWIFFAKDYNYIVKFIQLQLPEGKKSLLVEIKQVFSNTIFKMLRAYGLIMFITFCELSIGFTIMRAARIMNNNYIYIIALLIAIFDILPVAGSGGILIPWAIVSFVMGNTPQTIGIIVLYAVMTVIRQYIEPKIVGSSLGVNPIITLAGLYFGLKLFGFMGMFIVPISIMTLKAFNDIGRIKLWVPAPAIPAKEKTKRKSK